MSQVKFKLTLTPKLAKCPIGYPDKLFLIGSCFTENIGAKLAYHQFEILENPHGVLFNPVSVHNAIQDYISNKKYTAADLFLLNDVWNSWNHHSRFSGVTQQEALDKMNDSIQQAHIFLKSAKNIMITLGSSWLYNLNDQAPEGKLKVVANNHKAPAAWFDKTLMQPNDLIQLLRQTIESLKKFNPGLQIIFTISPVRHLREGLVENNRSKAVLIHSVHEAITTQSEVAYFPAYEYVMDDLRDYRFYSEDLVHPNYAATQYVFEQFVASYMTEETQAIMRQVAEIQLAMQHKPFFVGSSAHQKFIASCIVKTEQLMALYPFLPLMQHLEFFKGQVAK
jgi:hypothetical protein